MVPVINLLNVGDFCHTSNLNSVLYTPRFNDSTKLVNFWVKNDKFYDNWSLSLIIF